ncbi:hypothetical protein GWI33_016261 [Rhynchophorus ferrugineus]|uniref:Uncharacterized protein n=1 Tax=Rhynchophorus ferrugineus TaxID=354439 RepID=A0A834I1Y9_RHYFE|nr:hypothetical protein GWI33_016261 [Rhynchophorus ferrugineus]
MSHMVNSLQPDMVMRQLISKKPYKYACKITLRDPLLVEYYKSLDNKRNFKRIPKDIYEIDPCDIIAMLSKDVEKEDYAELSFEIHIVKELLKTYQFK